MTGPIRTMTMTMTMLLAQMFGAVAETNNASAAGQMAPPSTTAVEKTDAETVPAAHEIVKRVTGQMLAIVEKNRNTLEKYPQRYYADVKAILDPVIDFRSIARHIMGSYAKEATQAQRRRFAEVIADNLVSTYTRGIAEFGDREIVTLPADGKSDNFCAAAVKQQVRDGRSTHRVGYIMRREKRDNSDEHCIGDWKLANIYLNGINLGKVFQNQFSRAVLREQEKHGKASKLSEILDTVIGNWLAAQ